MGLESSQKPMNLNPQDPQEAVKAYREKWVYTAVKV
jgi:hypothetical protein